MNNPAAQRKKDCDRPSLREISQTILRTEIISAANQIVERDAAINFRGEFRPDLARIACLWLQYIQCVFRDSSFFPCCRCRRVNGL
jgi:hypothetical protein